MADDATRRRVEAALHEHELEILLKPLRIDPRTGLIASEEARRLVHGFIRHAQSCGLTLRAGWRLHAEFTPTHELRLTARRPHPALDTEIVRDASDPDAWEPSEPVVVRTLGLKIT